MNREKIAVLGAGTMGGGIAAVYALSGQRVSLYSRTEKTLEKARETVASDVKLLLSEKLYAGDAETVLGRIDCTTDLAAAVDEAWYVAETVVEKPEVKEEIYRQLDALCPPETYISSNTSYLNVFPFLPKTRQSRFTIVHWVAPPHILPLVEIVRGPETAEETMRIMMDFHEACGKTPVRLEKYVPGFILNRLQSAMNREVLGLIEGGYASPEMLDRAVKASLMPRGLALGVVQRMDFNGLDQVAHGLRNKSFTPFDAPAEDNPLTRLVRDGRLGVKSGCGFRDYTEEGSAAALEKRDRQLLKSVKLAGEFMADPIGRPCPEKEENFPE